MKRILQLTTLVALLAMAVVWSGCASGEQPQFPGRYKHSSPSIDDYYPSKDPNPSKSTNQ